jgi:two-component system CheB/CheR fusion protein
VVDADNLHKVFDLFSQAENQHTTHQREGLGIGLSLVRQLVEAHGGSVDVRSEGVGRGCTFTIRLPLCRPHQQAADQAQACGESGRLSGQKILPVDDSQDVMEVLQMLLEMEDAHVEAFSDPLLALEAAKEGNYDVIISDIGMPVMDGHALIQAIRQIVHHKYMPAIALTGYATSSDQKKTRQSGFNYHVGKPVAHDDFIDLIDEACKTRPY